MCCFRRWSRTCIGRCKVDFRKRDAHDLHIPLFYCRIIQVAGMRAPILWSCLVEGDIVKQNHFVGVLVIALLLCTTLPLTAAYGQGAPSSPTMLVGHVYLQNRSNHSGVIISLGAHSTTTSSDGGFVLPNVPTGDQMVTASVPGFLFAQTVFRVSPGQATTLPDVTLLGGDVDQDGEIRLLDLVAMGAAYGTCPPQDSRLDLTADGCLNLLDLVILGANYGKTAPVPWGAPPVITPSPTSAPSPTWTITPAATPILPDGSEALCTGVDDGDTIWVQRNGVLYEVRYIGIDSPEEGRCYYQEATDRNRGLVEGRTVRLDKDTRETDAYQRALRYVYVGDVFINAELVREGYAWATVYPPDTRHAALFEQMEQEAVAAMRGLWAACRTPAPTNTPAAGAQSISALECYGRDEWLEIRNNGTAPQIMTSWAIVSDVGSQRYEFPQGYTMPAGGSVRIHSGPDALDNPPGHIQWTTGYIWNNDGDKAELYDAQGRLVSSRSCTQMTTSPTPTLSAGCISADDAPNHVGEQVCVEFFVARAHNTGQRVFLNSQYPYEGHFEVVMEPAYWGCWPEPPEEYFDQKQVRVRGIMTLYGTQPQIAIQSCSQVTRLQ